jgi:hypothetical protein
MELENQVFMFKIDLSQSSDPVLTNIYQDSLKRIDELMIHISQTGLFENLNKEAYDAIIDDINVRLEIYCSKNKMNIPNGCDDSNSIFFKLERYKFNIKITGKKGEYKIIVYPWSDCINILGVIGEKFIFRRKFKEGDGMVEEQNSYLISSSKISYLNNFDVPQKTVRVIY